MRVEIQRRTSRGTALDSSASGASITQSDGDTFDGPVRARVLRTISEIEKVRDAWMGMQWHPNSDIDFFLQVLNSGGGNARPHVLVLYRNRIPDAILVGRLEDTRLDLKIGYAAFLRPKMRALTFVYGGLLGNASPDNCRLLANEVISVLNRREADFALFNHLRADSALYTFLRSDSGFCARDRFPALQTHRRMSLPSNPEAFWARLSPKVRKNQRWQAKKLLSDYDGNVQVRCFRGRSDLAVMLREIEQVAKRTYQRGLGVGFSDNESTQRLLNLKAEKGWLRTYVLYVAERPCAFWSGTIYDGVFHSDFMGYDPEHSKYSPGMYLVMQVIEEFCRRGAGTEVAAVDFGLGDAQYKKVLANTQWQDATFYAFAPTPRGLALNAIRTPVLLLDRLSRRMLEETRLLGRVKRLWRRRAISKQPADDPTERIPPSPDGESASVRQSCPID